MSCNGRGGITGEWKHCCVLGDRSCPYLVENQNGRRYACGLFVELGSWAGVESDPRYQPIADHFASPTACRDWQPKAEACCLEVRDADLG